MRRNPTLVILSNPEAVPGESAARTSWSKFHLRDGRDARIYRIPDAPGLPKTVVVLGALEGVECVSSRSPQGARQTTVRKEVRNGPWLVTDIAARRLWLLGATAAQLRSIPSRGYLKAVYYFPGKNSGKFHPTKSFRHEFGEGRHPKSQWHHYYPALSGSGRVRSLKRPQGGYTVEDRGIVG